jgi:nucleoside-diphosphate-sugar epimerase
MHIFITGISGFIGSHLAHHLARAGHEVSGSARNPPLARAGLPAGSRLHAHVLGAPVNAGMFDGCDAVVHAAYDLGRGAREVNVLGTQALFRAAEAAGVRRQLFLSSYSAHPAASSEYGQSKMELQGFFAQQGQPVARPALVLGPGGLFARIAQLVRKLPVLPLLDGGRKPVPILAIDDLVRALEVLLTGGRCDVVNLANAEPVRLLDIIRTLEDVTGNETLLVPVPARLLLAPLQLLEKLPLPLPISSESLQGYLRNEEIPPSDLASCLGGETPLRIMVERSVQALSKQAAAASF